MDALTYTFTICAAVGGALFIVRLILQFTGAFGPAPDDISGGVHDTTHSDFSFKVLSFQGITAFLMMFGLAGRALLLDSHSNAGVAVAGASIAGLASVWIIGKLFSLSRGMQSSGTMSLQDMVGAEGSVYLNIPDNGTGQVSVNARNRQMVHDAVTENKSALGTGTPVKVVGVSGNVLVVSRI